jgi:hypothetical protein
MGKSFINAIARGGQWQVDMSFAAIVATRNGAKSSNFHIRNTVNAKY